MTFRSCALAALLGAAAAAQATEFRSSDIHPDDYPTVLAVRHMSETLAKATGGKHSIKVFAKSVLGNEKDTIEQTKLGALAMTRVNVAPMNNICPATMVPTMPFLFRSTEHMRKVLDGPIGQDLLAKFRSRNLIALAWGEQGFRHLTNSKRAVNGPADMKGLKIRTMENPVHLTAFRTLGAAPTPMAWPEVIGALQQGTIDGQENPMSVIVSAKLAEVQKHLTLTGHVYSPAALLVSTKLWNSLDDAGKKALTDGARTGVVAMRAYVDDVERRGVEAVRAAGMQVIELRDRSAFQKALEPAYKQYYSRYDKALIDAIANTR